MTEINYLASSDDVSAVNEALKYLFKDGFKSIFKEFERIEKTLTISYDSKNIYLWWFENGTIKFNTFPHDEIIPHDYDNGWIASLPIKELNKYLPDKWKNNSRFEYPRISGGLMSHVISVHSKSKEFDPYTTRNSYLATIIHEFGHVYYESFKENSYYYRDKGYNQNLIKTALNSYKNEKGTRAEAIDVYFPRYKDITEVYAFCTEYYASQLCWPDHKENLDKAGILRLQEMLNIENSLDYNKQDSTLKKSHNLADCMGKIIIDKYKENWSDYLLSL